jgi:nucleotide-binding universal stress UspA family protein
MRCLSLLTQQQPSPFGDPRVGQPEAPCSAGAALLTTASRSEATLVVMGAYTHSRLRQSFLGGVTRHVLSEATVPILMSH